MIFIVSLIEFSANIKNGAQNGAPWYNFTLSQIKRKMTNFRSDFEIFTIWSERGAPFWAPFFIFAENPIRLTIKIIWNQKLDWFDKNSFLYPKMKCPNRNFQKSARALWFWSLKIKFNKPSKMLRKWRNLLE